LLLFIISFIYFCFPSNGEVWFFDLGLLCELSVTGCSRTDQLAFAVIERPLTANSEYLWMVWRVATSFSL
jgi:hypothetical protein